MLLASETSHLLLKSSFRSMRNNQPVVDRESVVASDKFIVSSTNPKGVITECNDYLCQISGFARDELIGQAHNIFRHPDMPQAAFAQLWACIQAGQPWMGIVKNRCKDGGYYWVDAFVTPLKEHGEIVGYQSVRAATDRAWIDRANRVYRRIQAGESAWPAWITWRDALPPATQVTLGLLLLVALGVGWMQGLLVGSLLVLAAICMGLSAGHHEHQIAKSARAVVNDPLAQYIYTGNTGALGAVRLAQLFQQGMLRTSQYTLKHAAHKVAEAVSRTANMAQQTVRAVDGQQQQTDLSATAIEEMSQSINEVAQNTMAMSTATSDIVGQSSQGKTMITQTVSSIQALSDQVDRVKQVISELAADSEQVDGLTSDITAIADQTNLLALNAAIEAARAGESGRGFAVVADEVRALATRTQESTESIRSVIDKFRSSTSESVTLIEHGHRSVVEAVNGVQAAGDAITRIAGSISQIEAMSYQVATACEEQSSVAQDVSKSVHQIRDLTDVVAGHAQEMLTQCETLLGLAQQLEDRAVQV